MRGQATGRIIKSIGAPLEHDPLENVTQHVLQSLITSELGDCEMHVLIVNQPFAGESFFDIVPVGIDLGAQARESRVGEIGNRFFHSERFQRLAKFVQLFGLLHSNFFAGKTPIR